MLWILSLVLLVALQSPHGSARLIGKEIEEDAMEEDVDVRYTDTTPDWWWTTTEPWWTTTEPWWTTTEPWWTTTIEYPTTTPPETTRTTTSWPITTTAAPNTCEPSCVGATNDRPMVADPLDCHKFYACIDGEPMGPLDCQEDEYFDPTEADCVLAGPEECEPICPPVSGGGCAFVCGSVTNRLVADRFDCSSYYDCSDSDTIITCDDETPFFDGEKCQTDESKCCHCQPYCYAGDKGQEVIDPMDCTKYYLCMEDNSVPEFSGSCSAGNFDPFRGACSVTAPCVTLCTNVVNSEGCIDVFTCHEEGFFPACPSRCDPRSYYCDSNDMCSIVVTDTCGGDNVFHPDVGHCVHPDDCPYPPAGF